MSNVIIEKLYQDQVWVIKVTSTEDASVDAWERAVRAYFQHGRNNRYLIYDLSGVEKISLTPYMQQRIVKLAQDNPAAVGRVAVIMNISAMLLYVFEPFARLTVRRIQPDLEVKFFHQRQAALDWVTAILPDVMLNGSNIRT
jgi:hypothetical protein